MRNRPFTIAEMLLKDESKRFDRGLRNSEEDPQTPETLGSKSQPPVRRAYAPEGPPMAQEYHIDYTDSQVPVSDNWLYAGGHVFSVMDPQYPEVYPPLADPHSLIFERTDGSKG